MTQDIDALIERALGGEYRMSDGRAFWIDGPVAREMTRRVTEALAQSKADGQPRQVDQEVEPFAYAYRYPSSWPGGGTEIRLGTGGRGINGSKPIETIPLYTKDALATLTRELSEARAAAESLRAILHGQQDGSLLRDTLAELERVKAKFAEEQRAHRSTTRRLSEAQAATTAMASEAKKLCDRLAEAQAKLAAMRSPEIAENIARELRENLRGRLRHRVVDDTSYVRVIHLNEELANYCHAVNWPDSYRAAIQTMLGETNK